MSQSIESQLAELRSRSLHRRMREVSSSQQSTIEFAGQRLVNFASNDYLGLAADPVTKEAAKRGIDEFGVGAGASRLVCGTTSPHVRLEAKLAEFKATESALTFSTGYAAAVGTIGALMGREDVIILDKLCHASLIDGARLSRAVVRVFPHNHLGQLESHLDWAREHHPDARVLVLTESIFSMDGDVAPLAEIVEIKSRFNALLMVDEAHAIGVIGKQGRGLVEKLGLGRQVEVQMGTLSKALGTSGGYVCGSRKLIDLLVNRSRSFVYSTAPPPAISVAAAAALDFLGTEEGAERRRQLWSNLARLAAGVPGLLNANEPVSAIVPVMLGEEETALAAAAFVAEQGFFIPAIRYPTVAKGTARLRVTVSARHTEEQIDGLCKVLRRLNRAGLAGASE